MLVVGPVVSALCVYVCDVSAHVGRVSEGGWCDDWWIQCCRPDILTAHAVRPVSVHSSQRLISSSQPLCAVASDGVFILWMGKGRHTKIQQLVLRHLDSKQWSWDLNAGRLASNCGVLYSSLRLCPQIML